MNRLTKLILLLILVIVIGGGVFLITWDIPAPVAEIERVIPNDRFPR